MAYITGENRDQLTLKPMCLDDYIEADSICRVIAAYVGSLDMEALEFKYAQTKATGRPPYAPDSMLMLYLYGYLNRVRSSRRLEAETRRNVEVMWLMEKLTPDDRTICNFRKDNATALKKVFREFSVWCNNQDLFGRELGAVDGSKFRADSSRKNIHTQKGTEKKLAEVEKKIGEYMNELDANDKLEQNEERLTKEAIADILKHLDEKKETLQRRLKQIEANDGKEISAVDADAHLMHTNGDGRNLDACYNVQTYVDEKHKLIVDFDVTTCPDDKGALPEMTERAKEIMGVSEIAVAADKGYYDGDDIQQCEESGTTCYVPKVDSYAHAPDEKYDKKHFNYDAEKDCYTCPQGNELPFRRLEKRKEDKLASRIYYNTKACRDCPCREKCTTSKSGGRRITRNPYQNTLDFVNARMKTDEARQIFRERKKIVEHPFGTVKAVWGYKQFLCVGKEKTTAEMSLAFLAYNFRRVYNIFVENKRNMAEAMT